MSTEGFHQSRKEFANTKKNQIEGLLSDHYEAPVANVEQPGGGEYSQPYSALQLLDFNGVDWVVNANHGLIPIAERVRSAGSRNPRYFTLRVNNGRNDLDSERHTFPKAIEHNCLYPRKYLLCISRDDNVVFAYLVDVKTAMEKIEAGEITYNRREFDDGTVSNFYNFSDLLINDCVDKVLKDGDV